MAILEKNIAEHIPVSPLPEQRDLYTPTSLIGVYANQLRTELDGKLILIQGKISLNAVHKVYGGYFYANLLGMNDTSSITLVVPEKMKVQLVQGDIYTFKGFIDKKVNNNGIQLQVRVDAIIQKEVNLIDPAERKKLDLLQQKANSGYKDFRKIVTENVYNNRPTKIVNIYGNNGIVDQDFEKGLSIDAQYFDTRVLRCNLNSVADIIETIRLAADMKDRDAIAIIRGGGSVGDLEIFNNPEIGAEVLNLEQCFLTALGHDVNDTLLDRLADKKFSLPHQYGTELKAYVSKAVEDKNNSKSALIDQIRQDFLRTHGAEVDTLQKQLAAKNTEFVNAQKQFNDLKVQLEKHHNDTLTAKQQVFQTEATALKEQIKAKDTAIREHQTAAERLRKESIAAATAEIRARLDQKLRDEEKLQKQVAYLRKKDQNLIVYLLLAAIVGFLLSRLWG
jgi:exodeoxyribonuclease VII large subunit